MDIACVSDCHGNLNFEVPKSDLLLIAGDICPARHNKFLSIDMQYEWLEVKFIPWLNNQPVKEIVFVFGNHDWIGDYKPLKLPEMPNNCHYLEDVFIEIMSKKIYGTPVQPPFYDWAFNRREGVIQLHWDKIPEGLDMLLLHCPPYGILDQTNHPEYPSRRIGSKSLLERIKKVKPKYVIFGHNHGENGIVEQDGITYVNCSIVNERYKLTRKPIILEI